MRYVLMAIESGDALGEFDALADAEAALDRVLAEDPGAVRDLVSRLIGVPQMCSRKFPTLGAAPAARSGSARCEPF